MSENVAGLLCYALGWITGLIFYFVDKRPFVRFHAAQSIVVFGGLHILYFIVAVFFGMSLFTGGLGGFFPVPTRAGRRPRTRDDSGCFHST